MNMKLTLATLAFIATGPILMAQSQSTVDKAAADNRSCMLMSDSVSTVLGLSEEQAVLVRKSDERCLQACEKAGYRTTGQMDMAAMREHEFEMREILTPEQFATWSSMCVTGTE